MIMGQTINTENFMDARFDAFSRFGSRWGIVVAGNMDDFNCMTLGWGMFGNVWSHTKPSIAVFVQPSRYTFEYMDKNEYFTVCFLPESHRKDAEILGTVSGRDCDKISLTNLSPKALSHGVGFEEAELTFVCRKVSSQQFDLKNTPPEMQRGMYSKLEPHYMYIGYVEEAFGEID